MLIVGVGRVHPRFLRIPGIAARLRRRVLCAGFEPRRHGVPVRTIVLARPQVQVTQHDIAAAVLQRRDV
eukprot:44250-Eustigmatos_ZCMA.PRE.1